jgi:hypothetical protein
MQSRATLYSQRFVGAGIVPIHVSRCFRKNLSTLLTILALLFLGWTADLPEKDDGA